MRTATNREPDRETGLKNRADNVNKISLSAPRARGEGFTKLAEIPEIQLIYVSALACTRHKGGELVKMQRQGCLSYLLLDEIDMITGDYISKTQQAAAQIATERNPTGIILLTGCQSALLSTDYGLLTQDIEGEIGIPVRVHDGCRLCGFDEEEPGTSTINQLLYDFIRPADKHGEPSVNILGSARLDESNELFSVLRDAGVKKINCLSDCKSREDYQEMGRARLNIITSAQDMSLGPYLQEKLGIDWVCLGGVYGSGELESSYRKLGEVFGADIDVSSFKNMLDEKLRTVERAVGGRAISVEGDAEAAKWLLSEGFSVDSLLLSPRQSLNREQRGWFEENMTNLRIENSEKGGRGGHARGNGGGSDRGRGRGERGARGSERIRIGYAGSMDVLEYLNRCAGGAAR